MNNVIGFLSGSERNPIKLELDLLNEIYFLYI